jgi:histidine ammonia-lyase
MKKPDHFISQVPLTLNDFGNFLRRRLQIRFAPEIRQAVEKARRVIDGILIAKKPVYGVNTGFGNFSEVRISVETVNELQHRLVLSHAAGVGPPMPHDIVRLIMLLKIKSLALGYSGCRWETLQLLTAMLNHQILPVIPQKGSVGASGDLAPLAHLALVMIGQGSAFVPSTEDKGETEWQRLDGKQALKKYKLKPVTLNAKEGLAILNGTQAITAYGLWTLLKADQLVRTADVIGSMTLESLLGTLTPFDERIQQIRNHPGQSAVAQNFRRILAGSPIVASHKDSDHKVQDAYSLRCIPQVHGAVRDGLGYITRVFLHEANGVTDNPLVFAETGEVLSGGNFHGAPVAGAADFMAILLTDLASLSERRIEHMLDHSVSELPPFLTEEGGLNSGFMMAHVTAAALVSECKVLSHPASVDSIPTSANKEDHVSMGLYAARKASEIVQNLEYILAIELLCACQALDFRGPLKPSDTTTAVRDLVRKSIAFWKKDRLMAKDITLSRELIRTGRIVRTAESRCGSLN